MKCKIGTTGNRPSIQARSVIQAFAPKICKPVLKIPSNKDHLPIIQKAIITCKNFFKMIAYRIAYRTGPHQCTGLPLGSLDISPDVTHLPCHFPFVETVLKTVEGRSRDSLFI